MARALERHFKRTFAGDGYEVKCFDRASPAIDLMRELHEREERAALAVADQGAPEMSGLDLLREARRLHPEVRTILLCAHADLAAATEAIDGGLLDRYLIKPFDGGRDLMPIVSDLLESWQGTQDRDAAGVQIVGERESPRAYEIRRFLERNQVLFRWLAPTSEVGSSLLRKVAWRERTNLPVAIFADGVAIGDPSNLQLASQLGIATKPKLDHYDLAIVGGGPAGLASAVYGSSEGLSTLMLEREAPGGQAAQSASIENYLGFPSGLTGAELSRRALAQAQRFKAEIVRPAEVTGIEPLPSEDLVVHLADGSTVMARGVVIATGASYRRLTAPGVSELIGRGIYYGASMLDAEEYAGRRVVIVGGANSAGQATMNFAKYADRVTVLVRSRSLAKGMSQYLVDRIEAHPKIEVLTYTELGAAHGEVRLDSISLTRRGEPTDERLPADGVFIFIGAVPHTENFKDTLPTDDLGFLLTGADLGEHREAWPLPRDPYPLESAVPHVLVAGDVRHGSTKRVASATGEGAMAIALVHQCLGTRV